MKNLLYIFGLALGVFLILLSWDLRANAAPTSNYSRTVLPETDSTYDLGSALKAWRTVFTDELCLSGDCKSAWPSGSGGTGNVATSTTETAGQLAYWTSTGGTPALLGKVATTTLAGNSQVAVSNSPVVIGGSGAVLSIVADSIGDSQLAFNTGQNLTTASSPTFAGLTIGTLSGVLIGSSGVVSAGADGTDYTLINALTCDSGEFFSAATAAGAFTCSAPTGTGITELGSGYATTTGTSITFSTTTLSFNGLTLGVKIVPGTDNLTFTPTAAGTLDNTGLTNSSVSYGGVSVSLGGSDATPAFNLADATGLPISTGVSGLGANVATFLATPSSANLATAVTGETGSGALVFDTSPTFTTSATFPYNGLRILETSGTPTQYLAIAVNQDYSANRTLTFATGDADRTITLSGSPTLADWFDQSVKQAASPTFAGATITGASGVFYTDIGGTVSTNSSFFFNSGRTALGVGTSSPRFSIHVASSTGPQIALSDTNITQNHWTFRNKGGEFAIATASPTTFATSSVAALKIDVNNVATFGNKLIAAVADFAAGVLRIPISSAPTIATNGDIGIDTTSHQFKYFSTATRVLGDGNSYPAFTYATTTTWTGTTTVPLGPAFVGETWNGVKCFTDTGTVGVNFYDGTNRMEYVSASTTVGNFGLATNNTFTASEKRYVDLGTPGSSPTKISCTVSKSLTAD